MDEPLQGACGKLWAVNPSEEIIHCGIVPKRRGADRGSVACNGDMGWALISLTPRLRCSMLRRPAGVAGGRDGGPGTD